MTRTRAVLAAIVLAVVAAAVIVPALLLSGSSATRAHGDPLAMVEEDPRLLSSPVSTLEVLRDLGVDAVRLSVAWNTIAPDPSSLAPPGAFNGADPASYPAASWRPFDAVAQAAQGQGIQMDFLLTGPAPLWATRAGAPAGERASGAWEPRPVAYGRFVRAIATRYSGAYTPPGASSPLPRVSFWEIWNEPNWGPSLQPQMALHPLRIVSAPEYRRLLDAAWRALKRTGHVHDTVVIGSLSPRGITAPPSSALAAAVDVSSPLGFTRTLYCANSSDRPLRGVAASQAACPSTPAGSLRFRRAHPALFDASGFGIHPYPVNLPPTEADTTNPDTVEFSQISRLTDALDRLQRAYGAAARLHVYNTEYGYITNPPNVGTQYLSPTTAARYLNWTEYLTWRNPRLATTMQYLLYDPLPGPSAYGKGGFATGLMSYTGVPKATFYAYRMPIFLPVTTARHGHALEVWGSVRPAHDAGADTGRPQYAQIQFSPLGRRAFRTIKTVPIADPHGYFDVHVTLPASGLVRLAWSYPPGDPFLVDPVTPDRTTIYSRAVRVTIH
jgi:hypothetical protein